MPATSPVILILGAGANIGKGVAQAFSSKGYKTAILARSVNQSNSSPDCIYVQADLSEPGAVVSAFSKVKEQFGIPSVVVYNASAGKANARDNPLSYPVEDLTQSLHVNTISAFVAAQQAVLAFEQLPESASKTFIYTGNILNETIMAPLLAGGAGKTATAHIIQLAASAYKDRGYKFYYADERKPDGSAKFGVDGDAHGKLFVELAEGKTQGPWQQTFVKDVGYKQFPRI